MTDSAGTTPLARPLVPSIASPAVVAVALVALATIVFHLSGPLGPDVSWLITVSERILDGGVLYVDILEPNPPMAGYLYMPPVLLARLLGIAPEPLVVAYTVAFGLTTTGFAARMIGAARLMKRADLVWPVTFLLVGAGWGEDFAQREHFAAMAMLPLLAAVAVRATRQKPDALLWIVAGLCGGFVLAIKPHFALAILLPALYGAYRQRSLKAILAPEFFVAGSIFLAFLSMVAVLHPAFFTKIVPIAETVYITDRRDPLLLLRVPVAVIFEAMLVFAVLAYRKRIGLNPLLGALFWSATGFGLAYLLQGRGYTYQLMPAVALLGTFLVLCFTEGTTGKDRLLDNTMTFAAAVLMAAVPMINDVNQWRMREPLIQALAPYGSGLRIANLSPDLTAASPLHRVLGAELVNSPPALLMSLSAIRLKRDGDPRGEWLARIEGVEAAERATLREDVKKRAPDIIVTTRDGYDWLAWAREDAELAVLLDDFEEIDEVMFDGYRLLLLKRKGLVPSG